MLAERLLLAAYSPVTGAEVAPPKLGSGSSTLRPTIAAGVIADLIDGGHAQVEQVSSRPYLAADSVLVAVGETPSHPLLGAAHTLIAAQSKHRKIGRYLSLHGSHTAALIALHHHGLLTREVSGSRRSILTHEGAGELARSRWKLDAWVSRPDADASRYVSAAHASFDPWAPNPPRPHSLTPTTQLSGFTRRFTALVVAGPLWERMWKGLPRKQRTQIVIELRAVSAELIDTSSNAAAWRVLLATLTSSSTYSV